MFYDFETPDTEDSLRKAGIVHWKDPSGRSHIFGIWRAIVYPIIVICILLVVPTPFKSIPSFVAALIALVLLPYTFQEHRKKQFIDAQRDTLKIFKLALEKFFLDKLKSASVLLCMPIVLPLIVLNKFLKKRHLPHSEVAQIFCGFSLLIFLTFAAEYEPFYRFTHELLGSFGFDPHLNSFLNSYAGKSVPFRFIFLPIYWLHFLVAIYILAAALAFPVCAIYLLFGKRVSIEYQKFPSFISHMSDLHITDGIGGTIEKGGKSDDEVLRDVQLSCEGKKLFVASGDITDSGGRNEWKVVIRSLNKVREVNGVSIFLAPGNHDIFPYSSQYRPLLSSLDMNSCLPRIRKIRYLAAVLNICPPATLIHDSTEITLEQYLQRHESKLRDYATDSTTISAAEIDAIWDGAFPMYWKMEGCLVVALDTNRPPSTIFTSAFGKVGTRQIARLHQIVAKKEEHERLIIIGHHHIYTPPATKIFQELRMKFLELLDSDQLVKGVQAHDCHYLHGHRHYDFEFSIQKLNIRSAPSAKFPK